MTDGQTRMQYPHPFFFKKSVGIKTTTIDGSKHHVTNHYHPEHYGLYPIAGKYSGWQ